MQLKAIFRPLFLGSFLALNICAFAQIEKPKGACEDPDTMPVWAECVSDETTTPDQCTTRAMYLYIQENAKKPEGMAQGGSLVVEFDINEEGKVDWAMVLRSNNEALEQAAIDLVKGFPTFIPGIHFDKKQRVRQTVMVRFQ